MWLLPALLLTLSAHAEETDEARRQALRLRMSVRHAAPTCDTIDALTPDPVADLIWLMDHVEQPPWVGMRAAECIIANHAEAETVRLHQWVADPDRKGLMLMILSRLDKLPEPLAHSLAKATLAGPHRELARPRLMRSNHVPVRALVEPE
jgi:hypothetical protein